MRGVWLLDADCYERAGRLEDEAEEVEFFPAPVPLEEVAIVDEFAGRREHN